MKLYARPLKNDGHSGRRIQNGEGVLGIFGNFLKKILRGMI